MFGILVDFRFNLLPQRVPSAPLLGNYIIRKLYYKFRLGQILNPVIRGLSRRSLIGLRINSSGRFTRAQRASHDSLQFGRVPLNNFSLNIDYINRTVPLRYGVCSIKIWMCYKSFSPGILQKFSMREGKFRNFVNLKVKDTYFCNIKSKKKIKKYLKYLSGRKLKKNILP